MSLTSKTYTLEEIVETLLHHLPAGKVVEVMEEMIKSKENKEISEKVVVNLISLVVRQEVEREKRLENQRQTEKNEEETRPEKVLGSREGKVRAERLTPERRSEISRYAAKKRWEKQS